MRTVEWDAPARVRELRDRLWLHLTPSVDYEEQLLTAALLLQLPPIDLLKLGRLHFLLSDELIRFTDSLPDLMRRLTNTTADEEEWSFERVRGTIRWNKTLSMRAVSGMPHAYVTAPTRRAYQTPENELLVFMLDEIVTLASETTWLERSTGRPGADLGTRVDTALRVRQHRALQGVERIPLTPRKVARIRSGRSRRRYAAALEAYDAYRRLVAEGDTLAIRHAVEHRGLVTRSDPTLFELLCTFGVIDALQRLGWTTARLRLFGQSLRSRATRGSEELTLWYQSVPPELRAVSRYRSLTRAHGMFGSSLVPDLVLRLERGGWIRYLIIEAKLGDASLRSGRTVEESARAALKDLLMYRRDYDDELRRQEAPAGLGLAWGAELEPVRDEIMLATPDHVDEALTIWMAD